MTRKAGEGDDGPRISAVVKFILGAGAVAAALASIIGLVVLVIPDSEPPPARLSATISKVQVDPEVTLAEFLDELPRPVTSGRRSGPTTVFASMVVAQAPVAPPPPVVPPPPVAPPPVVPPPVAPPPVVPPPVAPPPVGPPPPVAPPPVSPPPSPPVIPPPSASPPPPSPASESPQPPRVAAAIARIDHEPLADVVELTTTSSAAAPPAVAAQARSIVADDYKAPPAEVRTVLNASRVNVSDTAEGPPKLTPQGVVVNFRAEIEGYQGKKAVVRWSLFDARKRTRMPQPWLRSRKALTLIPQAGSDSGSQAVFVLLPRERGPYFARLELFDDAGNRLDLADTPSFDG